MATPQTTTSLSLPTRNHRPDLLPALLQVAETAAARARRHATSEGVAALVERARACLSAATELAAAQGEV